MGQHLEPIHLRLTELIPEGVVTEPDAPLLQAMASQAESVSAPTKALEKVLPPVGYGPPVFSARSARAGYAGTDFVLQPDGTLRCPDDKPLYPQERTRSANGSLRIVYAARISHCRACPLRSACQGSDKSPRSARRVSAVCQPLTVEGSALVLDSSVDVPAASVSVEAENPPTLCSESGSTPPASRDVDELVSPPPMSAPKKRTLPVGYGPPTFSERSAHAGFAGTDFSLQPDGTVLCPTKHPLSLLEQRPLSNGSIRMVYAARISHCRACPLRSACQGTGNTPIRARRVLAVCHPLPVPASAPVQAATGETESLPPSASSVPTVLEPTSAPVQAPSGATEPSPPPTVSGPAGVSPRSSPVLWEDWPASHIRQQWQKRLRTETVHLTLGPPEVPKPEPSPEPLVLTRAQRAHWRLSWRERFARNARRDEAPPLEITLHGLPASFAQTFALAIAA